VRSEPVDRDPSQILGNTFPSRGQPLATSFSFATTGLKSLHPPQNSRIPGSANCEIGNDGVLVSEHWSVDLESKHGRG
jgi:hypothetical protein